MDNDSEARPKSRTEQVLQHRFNTSREGLAIRAKLAGAAIVVDSGVRAISGEPQPLITEENDPKLYRAYKGWLTALRLP